MITLDLLKQNWLKNYRSRNFYHNLLFKILIGFGIVYFAVLFLVIGLFLDAILEVLHSTLNPMELLNGMMLYLVMIALLIRLIIQRNTSLDVIPYRALPVKRSFLTNFVLVKSLLSPVQYITLLIVIPFSIKSVAGYYSDGMAFRFVLNIIFIIWGNCLLVSLIN